MSADPDAVVIGAGPNGLTAAAVLARAGLAVLVLEANTERLGGALGSVESTEPGYLHDVGAAFFPFGKSSPAFNDLDLPGAGLQWLNAPIESAHPAPDASVAVLTRDMQTMGSTFGSEVDGAKMIDVAKAYARVEPRLLEAMLRPIPAIGPALRLGPLAGLALAWTFLASGRRLAQRWFSSAPAQRVIPGLALHTDVGPDDTFGSGIGYMLAVTATTGGYAVPAGGAKSITDALVRRIEEGRGTLRLGARVAKVLTEGGRAIGVQLEDGEQIRAKKAVLANTSAPALYLDLVERHELPGHAISRMERFVSGWGTFKVDWALDGPVPWTVEECTRAAVVHAGDDLDDLSRFTTQVRAGRLPDNPYLVIGQQSVCDPSRAPEGGHTLWAYSRVPNRMSGGWSEHAESFADRIEARIEGLAPGFRARIRARDVHDPERLERMSSNLIGGDLGGGSNAWHRQLVFRPLFPWFRYRTPVRGLYLCSSYTHPGAGVHGMCGHNAARRVLSDVS